ncbi:MAG: MFS transporter [Betaproteobacteria bacterium RBG_16_64_9]|nr:MAG: MFS transporter [Betaproteobacteria bacterium RBG_16_64_9]
MSQAGSHYYVPQPSHWMIFGSVALLCMASGAALWFNGAEAGAWVLFAGLAILFFMMFMWFGDVIRESESGKYGRREDVSFRWGMSWFIFSEVMFFGAFFGALYYARAITIPDLGSIDQKLLWPDYNPAWPTTGPGGIVDPFTPMAAWGIPAINTLLLLTSGVTITIAHYALKENQRAKLNLWLALTIVLGVTFLALQFYEYGHAYSELNLKLNSGIYGSTFFMLTGFHGFHVTMGVTMLTVILIRCLKGHFKPDQHFAFEAVAWYWHFVDVVWLGLFIFVYWL